MAGRNDVEHRRLGDLVGVVQRHPMHHAAAAVVADGRELVEPEVLHHFDLILGHRALGVAGMVLAVGRLAAVAVTPEVRRHHGIVLGQFRGHEMTRPRATAGSRAAAGPGGPSRRSPR